MLRIEFYRMLFLLVLSLGLIPNAFAGYTVSSLPGTQFDVTKRVHVILSGKGNDLGRLPILSTLAKAKKISKQFPNEQVLIINTQEVSDQDQNSMIAGGGFQILRSEKKLLDSITLMSELTRFKQIASFNFFGHSGIEPGMFLDGVGEDDLKWRPFSTLSAKLTGHFTADAYAILNGCNQGQIEAPNLSKTWGIPVAGTMTSSHFEQMYNDGKFYWVDDALRRVQAPHALQTLRMKPDDVTYEGYYGKYESGLPFFKFFCVGISDLACLTGMRASVYSLVSVADLNVNSSREDYLKVVREWLCPSQQYGSKGQGTCEARLAAVSDNGDRSYTPFRGPSLHCDFNSCYVPTCFSSAEAMTGCAKGRMPDAQKPSSSFVDEYLIYEKAF